MKLTIERDVLAEALGRAASIAARKDTFPLLQNVKLEARRGELVLTATDLDIEIAETIEAKVEVRGAATAQAVRFAGWAASLPPGGEVILEMGADDVRLLVHCGRARAALPVLPAADFPAIAAPDFTWGGTIDRTVLKRLFDHTAHAMSKEETRFILQSAYLHTVIVDGEILLRMTTTDGHRLACADVGIPAGFTQAPGQGVLIPSKMVRALTGLLDGPGVVELRMSDHRIEATVGGLVIGSKLIDGVYPDYERVIPREIEQTLGIEPARLSGALKRVAMAATDKSHSVKLGVEGGLATLSARGDDSAEAAEQFDVNQPDGGEPLLMGFGARYLADLLGLLGPRAAWGFVPSANRLLVTDSDQPGVRHVLMSVRV